MSIRITGRTGDVTAAMKAKAAAKVEKFSRFYDRITVVGKAESDDMYKAIDLAIDKMTRQLRKHKERQRDHRPRRGGATPPVVEEETPED